MKLDLEPVHGTVTRRQPEPCAGLPEWCYWFSASVLTGLFFAMTALKYYLQ